MHGRDAGFTLIEAATGMAILAIIVSIGFPSLNTFVQWQRTSAAMESLVTHMGLARIAAISHRRSTILCPSNDGASCTTGSNWSGGWMLYLDSNGNRRPDPGDEVLRIDLEPTSRKLQLIGTSGRPMLRYLPDGRSAGSNLTIKVCNHEGERLGAVIVNNTGRPRTERSPAGTAC